MSELTSQTVTLGQVQTAVAGSPKTRVSQRGALYRVAWFMLHDPIALTGLVITLVILTSAILAEYVAPYSPTKIFPRAVLEGPSAEHLLGTDELGRDMLSRIIYGARVSLMVGVGSVLLALPFGIFFGLIAGYLGGPVDATISRAVEVGFAFPSILLALLIVAVLGTDLINVVIALALIYIPRFIRVVRAQVLFAKQALYVEAATSIGCPTPTILSRHILPNVVSPIIVLATVTLATAVLAEASLSFLGLGVQPPTPAWGSMLNAGKHYMEQYPHLAIIPGIAIAITVLGFNFLGDGLRDALDPRLRSQT